MHVVLGCGEQGLRADIVVINEPRLGARGSTPALGRGRSEAGIAML
jgi:hypothetical protein